MKCLIMIEAKNWLTAYPAGVDTRCSILNLGVGEVRQVCHHGQLINLNRIHLVSNTFKDLRTLKHQYQYRSCNDLKTSSWLKRLLTLGSIISSGSSTLGMSIHSLAISIALSMLSRAFSGVISAKSGTRPGARELTRQARMSPVVAGVKVVALLSRDLSNYRN